MSLFRQLWLAVIALTLLVAAGSLGVQVYSARAYLEKQLSLKNADNAASLALSISQIPDKDPVALELLVSAQFDTGHYREIALTGPTGRKLVERKKSVDDNTAPAWFVRLVPINAAPGIAQVQDGWRQLGTLRVVSHTRFAYLDLWQSAVRQMVWALAAAAAAGLLGTIVLRLIVRPLDQVAEQAHAITQRRFIAVAEPRTKELRGVVRAMNDMVTRLKHMFADEANRLDALNRTINHDRLTGLPNRELFLNRLTLALSSEEAASHGVMMIVRLSELGALNRQLGHAGADAVLVEVATALRRFGERHAGSMTARLNGADHALLIPGESGASELAEQLGADLADHMRNRFPTLPDTFHIGVVRYRHGRQMTELLSAADQALASAEKTRANSWYVLDDDEAPLAMSSEGWRKMFDVALVDRRFSLALFPVVGSGGALLHRESAARLQPSQTDSKLSAADFMPMAVRLKLAAAIDLEIAGLAIGSLETGDGDIALNFSADSLVDWGFRAKLAQLLRAHGAVCRRLWIEVAEYDVFQNLDAFRDMAQTLKGLGCRVGVEHAGFRINEFSAFSDLGLDYLKIDGSFIRAIDTHTGNQELVRGLCAMAHSFGIMVIAENVRAAAEVATLPTLGLDGMTGPAVR